MKNEREEGIIFVKFEGGNSFCLIVVSRRLNRHGLIYFIRKIFGNKGNIYTVVKLRIGDHYDLEKAAIIRQVIIGV